MTTFACKSCGAPLKVEPYSTIAVCEYCGASTAIPQSEQAILSGSATVSGIGLSDDIERLLRKCKAEPKNARKYANLILDIDADNAEALKYL